MSDKEKQIHDKAVGYVNKFLSAVDVVQASLVKAENFLDGADELVVDLIDTVRNGIVSVNDFIDEYREEVVDRIKEAEKKFYPETTVDGNKLSSTGPVQDEVQAPSLDTPLEEMSREQKIAYLIRGYGLQKGDTLTDSFRKGSDHLLDGAVKALKLYNK